MPPLLENNKLIINFNPSPVPENISFEKTLSTFQICSNDIVKFIRLLDPNKTHDLDGISIRMSKLCTTSICKPLQILYKNCFDNACFPQTWKNANIIPIRKKGKKQLKKKNIWPVSLLPISRKNKKKKEKKFNSLFELLDDDNILNNNQSGFRSEDSCAHQLSGITNNICKIFYTNASHEVRGVFLNLSTTYDRVWHDMEGTV